MASVASILNTKSARIGAAIGLLVWGTLAFGMSPKVTSPMTGDRVSREQLLIEVIGVNQSLADKQASANATQERLNAEREAKAAVYEAAFDEMDRVEETGGKWLEIAAGAATTYATGGTIDPVSLIGSMFGLMGVGAAGGAAVDGGKKVRKKVKTTS